MAQDESGSREASSAEELFADFVARSEGGEEVEFEKLCEEHAAHAPALRAHFADWARVRGILERLGVSGSLASRLRDKYGSEAGQSISLKAEEEGQGNFTSDVLNRLSSRVGSFGRYKLKGEVARGGMGVILRVWDEDLRRTLAMKVILGEGDAKKTGETPPVDPRTLGRFLEEA